MDEDHGQSLALVPIGNVDSVDLDGSFLRGID